MFYVFNRLCSPATIVKRFKSQCPKKEANCEILVYPDEKFYGLQVTFTQTKTMKK